MLDLNGLRLEYEWIRGDDTVAPAVLLHEGLGSVGMWRDFPSQLAQVTGRRVLAYSRQGYGGSSRLSKPRAVTYMHDEALEVLPAFLDALGVASPLLIGHSDGASIALIHAGGSGRSVSGVVAMAPHVMVEDVTVAGIEATCRAYVSTDLRKRLARHHADVDGAFRGWGDIWLSPAFRSWNIEEYLPRIQCPVLAIQGEQDEYATMEQLGRIGRGAPRVELLKLDDCRHSPHRDQPDAVLEAIADFSSRQ